jgi:hypothetical protein
MGAVERFTNMPNLKGLAGTGTSVVWGIADGAPGPDALYWIETTGGNPNYVALPSTAIQGIAMRQGTLYGWQQSLGLMTIDTTNGQATYINPAGVASVTGTVRFLCAHDDGRLLAGAIDYASTTPTTSLYSIDRTTGIATLIGAVSAAVDLRGAVSGAGFASPFGQSSIGLRCGGAYGTIDLRVTGTPMPNGSIVLSSGPHYNIACFQVFGFSRSNFFAPGHGQVTLPLNLDPLFGTSGCSLFVSPDVSMLVFTGGGTQQRWTLSFTQPLPPIAAGLVFYVQRLEINPGPAIPGNMAWTNALAVRVGY